MVEEQAQSYEQPRGSGEMVLPEPERLREIESMVLEDNVVTWALGARQGGGQADRI